MDCIYRLKSRSDKSDACGVLIGFKEGKLYALSLEKKINDNHIDRRLKQSFEYCSVKSNEKPIDALFERGRVYSEHKSSKGNYRLIKLNTVPGSYYPRIYRPFLEEKELISLGGYKKVEKLEQLVLNYPDYNPNDTNIIVSGLNQLAILNDMLCEILNTIHPSNSNLKTYGHDIKNLLILSCIEVEAQLKGIYKVNEVTSKHIYTTNDYVRLKTIMQLHKYSVRLSLFPDLKTYYPFKTWNQESGATRSLKWYDSYNAVKHNSETDFHRATLDNAISSICAVVVLLHAQYGTEIPFWKEEIGSYFEIQNSSKWSIEEMVLPPIEGNDWSINKIGL